MSGMPPLFAIAHDYQDLLWLMADGETQDEEDLQKILKEVSIDLARKSANVVGVFLNLESQAQEIKVAELRMKKRRESLEKNAKRLREYLLMHMQSLDLKEIKTPEFLIRIRKNPHRVGIATESLIPSEFKAEIITTKIDKTAIREALKAGKPVPGASLEQTQRLEVR